MSGGGGQKGPPAIRARENSADFRWPRERGRASRELCGKFEIVIVDLYLGSERVLYSRARPGSEQKIIGDSFARTSFDLFCLRGGGGQRGLDICVVKDARAR